MEKFSYLKSVNVDYIDELFSRYLEHPESIDPTWRYFFEGMELGTPSTPPPTAPSTEGKINELITAYRESGRLLANINPLNPPPSSHPALEPSRFGLTKDDLPSEIITALRDTYCGNIAVEYTHIQNPDEREWLRQRMESSHNREQLDRETKKFILQRLTESESFERFLHTRYVAQKRFSVEGGESVIPALDRMIEIGAELGAREFVLGMAHRGRLNVLTNICGKKPEYIFTEFEGTYKSDPSLGEGDVKYHMGYSSDLTTRGGKKVHISLASNPSHLEFINPVVEGMARAKQTYLGDAERTQVIPILIHGDAAFAGQGVCYETLNLSQLAGYKTGGTLHIVINNQIGFTTLPRDSRSTPYSTDVAKMLESPIFHVNGDDPEAVWYLSKLCVEYRQKFKKDVFIDLVCYRKHGHNEGDEPTFTQPILYKAIKAHPSTREIYAEKLVSTGVLNSTEITAIADQVMTKLTEAQGRAKAEAPHPPVSAFEGRWKELRRVSADEGLFKPVQTAVPEKVLRELSSKINKMPPGFHLHPKLSRFFETRLKAMEQGKNIDWGNGETLAFATLLSEGCPVRLSGQDAERGTFTHRHVVLNDFESGETYTPINHISQNQARFNVHNSHLSETAVLGFEYGYSITDPKTLVIWEAQFGDFANGAQVIIDQFIATSESKWQRHSGLVLLLPHGFEGQGPEHSSARLERFLQLCGKNNIFVCNLTTPAQLFHALRRQLKRDFRKPLVIMSPKSLLRHPQAVSDMSDFTDEGFREVLDDPQIAISPDRVRRVLLCSGKVYYDLLAERANKGITETAIIRIEQLYPWPAQKLTQILKNYSKAKTLVWVQEEPRNMGAWSYVFNMWSGGYDTFQDSIGDRPLLYAGRGIGAAPAVGSVKRHEKEQASLVEQAFTEERK